MRPERSEQSPSRSRDGIGSSGRLLVLAVVNVRLPHVRIGCPQAAVQTVAEVVVDREQRQVRATAPKVAVDLEAVRLRLDAKNDVVTEKPIRERMLDPEIDEILEPRHGDLLQHGAANEHPAAAGGVNLE